MSRPTYVRSTILDDLGSASRNIFCRSSDLDNEASVETFFVSRLLKDLGYADKQIKTKHSLATLTVGRGSRLEKYKPDYALFYKGAPRCIVDAKGTGEDLNYWVEQCSGYCLALNRKYKNRNPVRFFVLSNGLSTVVYEWDRDEALLSLDFSDFAWGNPRYEHLKRTLVPRNPRYEHLKRTLADLGALQRRLPNHPQVRRLTSNLPRTSRHDFPC